MSHFDEFPLTSSEYFLMPSEKYNVSSEVTFWANRTPNSIAIISPSKVLTYQELEDEVQYFAEFLIQKGVKAGDGIALIISNELTYLKAWLAAARLWAPITPIPRATTAIQRNRWLTAARIRFIISDDNKSSSDIPTISAVSTTSLDYEQEAKEAAYYRFTGSTARDRVFAILIGSGSTGEQKLMPVTHLQWRSRAICLAKSYNITAIDRIATMAHMEYAAGIQRLTNSLVCGASFAILDRSILNISNLHSTHGITLLTATVFHAQQMLSQIPEGKRFPLEGIKLSLASSPISQELRSRIMETLCRDLWITYGTNESWCITVASPSDMLAYKDTVGRPAEGVTVKIVDQNLNELPVGVTGFIAVKSDQTISSYIDDEIASSRAFRNGWFLPGDLGRMTNDGLLIYCGRADDMMIFDGINIFPIEIEQCLIKYQGIADVVVLPARHFAHQDIPIAIVAPKYGVIIDKKHLRDYAASILGFKAPRLIIFVEAIPRTNQGKIMKKELMKLLKDANIKN